MGNNIPPGETHSVEVLFARGESLRMAELRLEQRNTAGGGRSGRIPGGKLPLMFVWLDKLSRSVWGEVPGEREDRCCSSAQYASIARYT